MEQLPWYRDQGILRLWIRAFFALAFLVWGGWFLYDAAFTPDESAGKNLDVIVGFVTTGLLAVIIQYYWGASDKAEKKDEP